jgi:hypothetical protein
MEDDGRNDKNWLELKHIQVQVQVQDVEQVECAEPLYSVKQLHCIDCTDCIV